MKYLRSYEGYNYEWKSIIKKNNKLYVHLYILASEMEMSVDDEHNITERETEYFTLVKKLMIGKVITFSSADSDVDKGICEDIEFHSGFEFIDDDKFQIEYIQIRLENMEYAENIDDDLVIIHTEIDPDVYRETKKYNL